MVDIVKAWVDLLGSMFGVFLKHMEFGAVVVGTLAAIGVTQAIKMMVIQWAPTNGSRALWWLVTSVIGVAVTFLNWPTRLGFSWGIVVGMLLAPGIYMLGTRAIVYKFWPDLERMISATPRE